MADPLSEELLSFAEAAKIFPRRRGGKKLHICTLYRWSVRGCRGVRLQTYQIGGTRCTSREALARFVAALTAQSSGAGPESSTLPTIRTSARRRRESERAERELIEMGA